MRRGFARRLQRVEREWEIAQGALQFIALRWGDTAIAMFPAFVDRNRYDVELTLAQAEGTYIVRLFAEFEDTLREYLQTRDNTIPDDATAATRIDRTYRIHRDIISPQPHAKAHSVRALRNHIAHGLLNSALAYTFSEVIDTLTRWVEKLSDR